MGNSKGKLNEEQASKKQEEKPKKPLNEHIEHIEPNHSDYEATEDQDNHGNQSNHGNSAGWTSGTGMVDLFSLVRSGSHTEVERLLQEGKLDVNMEDEDGHTPLMLAALHNDLDTIQVLLKYQANVRAQSSKTCTTALQEAVLNDGRDDVIALLQLEEDKALECMVQLFTVNGPLPSVLTAGISVDVRREDGRTPLMVHAAGDSNTDLVVELLDLGAQVDLQDKRGNTALMCAVEGGHLETVKELMGRGCNVNIKNMVGNVALDIARDKKFSEIEDVLSKALQKPVVTFESLLATFLSRPRRPKSADTLADTKRPLPFLSPSTADIPQEIQKDWEDIATLETNVHELTLMTCGDDPSDSKDESSYSFMELPRLEEEYKKLVEQKEEMKKLAVKAKVAAQKLSAENIQLKEDLNNLKQRHEAEKKELLKNLEKLRQDAAHADKRVESLQQAMHTEKRVARLPTVSRDGMLHPQKCILSKKSLSEMNYDIDVSLLRVVITGLPNCGKSKIRDHLIPRDHTKDCINNEEGLSVTETILTLDGHSWKWMQVSKTEASALAVGAGIAQAYAKEGHSPVFVIPEESSQDIIWESVRSGTRFADTKGLSLINVWDIGANKVLFDLLPLLLPRSKRLVVLSVVSLDSDAGDMHSHMHEGKHGQEVLREPYSKLDYLMAPPSIARCSTMVVGTHTGKLPRDRLRARQRTVERLVRASAEEMGIGNMLYPKCIAVDTSNQGDIFKIKSVLDEMISERHAECNRRVPLTWLCFRDDLNNCTEWYMPKDNLLEMAKNCGITDECNVETFLAMYYECGSIIYSPNDTSSILHDHVIFKPCEFLKHVEMLLGKLKTQSEHYLGRLKHTAKKWHRDELFVLKVLEAANLVIRVDNDLKSEEAEYIMPSLRPRHNSPLLCAGSSSLCVVFSSAVLPCYHLASFVKTFKGLCSPRNITYKHNDCCNQLCLQWVKDQKSVDVDVLIVSNYLEIKIMGFSDPPTLLEACSVLKSAAVDFAQCLCSQRSPELYYHLAVVCSLKPHLITFHALETVDADGKVYCPHCKKDVQLGGNAIIWLNAPYKGPRTAALTAEDVLTDDLIVTLSHELASLTPQQIVQLGMSLGYTAAETKEEMSLHTTVQEFILSMLQTWKNGYSLPIRERLSKVLAKCGYLTHVSEVHSIGDYTSSMQHPLSDEELQLVSQAVTDCTHIMKKLDIEGEGPESDCYKLLAQWSEQSGGDRAKLIDVLYSCDYAQVAELLWKRRAQYDVYMK